MKGLASGVLCCQIIVALSYEIEVNENNQSSKSECTIWAHGDCISNDKQKIPAIPMNINLTLVVWKINKVDDQSGTIHLSVVMRLTWQDGFFNNTDGNEDTWHELKPG